MTFHCPPHKSPLAISHYTGARVACRTHTYPRAAHYYFVHYYFAHYYFVHYYFVHIRGRHILISISGFLHAYWGARSSVGIQQIKRPTASIK